MKSAMINLQCALVLASACLSSVAAFQTHAPRQVIHKRSVIASLNSVELNQIDEMCIENVAEFCLHESCDIEEYEGLINQLEDQKAYFIRHLANVESLLARLKNSNHPEHDPDDVQKLIENIKNTLASSSTSL